MNVIFLKKNIISLLQKCMKRHPIIRQCRNRCTEIHFLLYTSVTKELTTSYTGQFWGMTITSINLRWYCRIPKMELNIILSACWKKCVTSALCINLWRHEELESNVTHQQIFPAKMSALCCTKILDYQCYRSFGHTVCLMGCPMGVVYAVTGCTIVGVGEDVVYACTVSVVTYTIDQWVCMI